jgi:hypothetical protein
MRLTLFLFVVVLVVSAWAPVAPASDWNRLSTVIFQEPVEVPGHVLPPGVYVFKLADISGERNVVQIWNADQTILYATVMGFPEYVSEGPAENQFLMKKNETSAARTLKAWFRAGNRTGERFIYPKKSTE